MEIIEHYEKFIESKIKLLHSVYKKREEIIESKQITEIERHKTLFTTKLIVIEPKDIKDQEESIDARKKQLDEKLEMIKDQLVILQQESQFARKMKLQKDTCEKINSAYNVTKKLNKSWKLKKGNWN